MATDDSWVSSFLAEKLKDHDDVRDVVRVSANLVRVVRKRGDEVLVAATGTGELGEAELERIESELNGVSFLVAVKSNTPIRAAVLTRARIDNFAVGSFKDLLIALRSNNVSAYVPKEIEFVLRSLGQHSNVVSVLRTEDRKISIRLRSGKTITAILISEYEVGADEVRSAYATYAPAAVLVRTNPNGHATSMAHRAAASIGVELLENWSSLFSYLGKK